MFKLVLYSHTMRRPITLMTRYATIEEAKAGKKREWLSCLENGWKGRVTQIRIKLEVKEG